MEDLWEIMDRWYKFFASFGQPFVDVIDRGDAIEVVVEAPGYRKEDLEIYCDGRLLTIKGERSERRKERKGYTFVRSERRDSFQRTIALPDDVLPEKAKANLKNGILTIILPKVKPVKGKRIKIEGE